MEVVDADVVVAGAGAGGLLAAQAAANDGARVVVLGGSAGASSWISSLNAALGDTDDDRPAGLAADMLRAGGELNNLAVLDRVTERIGPEIERLRAAGVPFETRGGRLARRRAAGSSRPWAVYTAVMAGIDIMRLVKNDLARRRDTVRFVPQGLVVDLTVRDGRVEGVLAYSARKRTWLSVSTPCVVLATGGAGQLFDLTTNQPGSRGSGLALALAAGAELVDLEFVSFEPLVVTQPGASQGRSLPTTVLNEDVRLLNGRGEEFLPDGPAPGKDIICRAMAREVAEGRGTAGGNMVLDVSAVPVSTLERYPKIGAAIRSAGSPMLEVMPAQHYMDGGIRIGSDGAATVPGLFAVGEASGGAHGAHRMAAAGGTEVVAMGPVVGAAAAAFAAASPTTPSTPSPDPEHELLPTRPSPAEQAVLDRVRTAMGTACGIIRSADELERSCRALREVAIGTEFRSHVGRSARVAAAIAGAALTRTESRGDHFRADFPDRDDQRWRGNVLVRQDPDTGEPMHGYQAVGG